MVVPRYRPGYKRGRTPAKPSAASQPAPPRSNPPQSVAAWEAAERRRIRRQQVGSYPQKKAVTVRSGAQLIVPWSAQIDPDSDVGVGVTIGEHVTIEPGAFVGDRATIGERATIKTGARVEPDGVVEPGTTVSALPTAITDDARHTAPTSPSDPLGFRLDPPPPTAPPAEPQRIAVPGPTVGMRKPDSPAPVRPGMSSKPPPDRGGGRPRPTTCPECGIARADALDARDKPRCPEDRTWTECPFRPPNLN